MIFWYEDKNCRIKNCLEELYENTTSHIDNRVAKVNSREYFLVQYNWISSNTDVTKFEPNPFTEEYIDKIIKLQSQNVTIIIDGTMEGTIYRKDLYNYLVDLRSRGLNLEETILASNNLTLPTFYHSLKVKLVSFPQFLISTYTECKSFIEKSNIKPKYRFLCLNRRMRLGKYKLLRELVDQDLLKATLYTWVSLKRSKQFPPYRDLKRNEIDNDTVVSRNDKLNDSIGLYTFNSDWHNSVKVDIVNETYYEESNETHITEKLYKSIMLEKPFVVNGTKNYLAELKKLGFKTFSTVIDESYDQADSYDRYKRVVTAALELEKVYDTKEVKDICKYNRELFYDLEHKRKILQNLFFNVI